MQPWPGEKGNNTHLTSLVLLGLIRDTPKCYLPNTWVLGVSTEGTEYLLKNAGRGHSRMTVTHPEGVQSSHVNQNSLISLTCTEGEVQRRALPLI